MRKILSGPRSTRREAPVGASLVWQESRFSYFFFTSEGTLMKDEVSPFVRMTP